MRPLEEIIYDRLSGEKLSIEEEQVFEEWMKVEEHRKDYARLQRLRVAVFSVKVVKQVCTSKEWDKVEYKTLKKRRAAYKFWLAVASVLLLGWGFFEVWSSDGLEDVCVVNSGKKMAVLTLSDGKEILLTDSSVGMLREEQGVAICQDTGHQLVYEVSDKRWGYATHRIVVPRGGEYVVRLSDGSVVWLNSESSLSYPVAFRDSLREVFLDGEAYFEVQAGSSPFVVHSKEMEVRVLGTQFNMKVYPGEKQYTTLVSGSVETKRGECVYHLNPGQQIVVDQEQVIVRHVELENFVAWRSGEFSFKQCRLEDLFKELARWYDLKLCFEEEEIKDYEFTAWFKRSASIEEVIAILEKTRKIKITLRGNNVVVKNR